ncbi:RTA1 domain protein [Penicillium cf. griseofulvum]|uniref:RTA1 domain protein n=1 Tax=Penicillium cf. griseofulvum TaxID=2972120 RepID=A0A9W9T2D7_9EURO|nr:RTA1 domain protein [Penicillium cf. griseofulvum]KAJ5446418.1 RTA1 domain protein [Penicillium cf. griseofulvum]KAJ5448159.1 RTA1 domain protein [Penicillium cf. griseofulvum]
MSVINRAFQCTLQTCTLDHAMIHYVPTLAGNALFLVLFGIAAAIHLFLGVWYRTYSYLIALGCGLLLEIIGYAGRISLHYDPFSFNAFLQYLICLTIAPAFICAGIYFCFGRVVIECNGRIGASYERQTSLSRLQPGTYSKIFIACDVVCLILQSAGGAITSTAGMSNTSLRDLGINVMIAGLACQVVSLAGFVGLAVDFAIRVRRQQAQRPSSLPSVVWETGWKWKAFVTSLVVATITIFIRSCFRVAELKGGFGSDLANDQVAFMILEGAMIIIACSALTAIHPGLVFPRERWSALAQSGLTRVASQSSHIEMRQGLVA